MELTSIAGIRFFGAVPEKSTRGRTRGEIYLPVNREGRAGKKGLQRAAGSPGRVKGGDVPCGEGRGGECGLEVVAPGVAVDIEHLADAVEVFDGL
jgi:hypothetical protein